jgi:hypothetical protein
MLLLMLRLTHWMEHQSVSEIPRLPPQWRSQFPCHPPPPRFAWPQECFPPPSTIPEPGEASESQERDAA